MKRRNTMTAAVFLLAVAAGFLLLATSFFGGEGKFEALLKAFVQNRDVMAFVDGAESAVNGDLDRDHLFIQLYGGVQRLSGRRVVEDAVGENTVVRLSTGGLNFVDLQAAPGVGPQVAENAAATAAFSQDLEALGIPYLYVNAPQKLQRGEALLPTGVKSTATRAPTPSWPSWSGRERTMWICAPCLRRTASTPTGFSAPITTGSRRRPFSPGRR